MDNSRKRADTTKIDKELRSFLNEIATGPRPYRQLARNKKEKIVKEQAEKLEIIFNDYYKESKENFDNYDVYTFLENYVSHKDVSLETQTKIRYNISDILQESENFLKDDEHNTFFEKYEETIAEMKRILPYIDNLRLSNIDSKLLALEVKLKENKQNIDDNIKNNNNIKESIKSNNEALDFSLEMAASMEKSIRDILPQAIAVLGIFMSILVVLVGGITILESFRALNETPLHKYTFSILGVSLLMINFLFILMFLISRISKTSINVKCTKFDDENPEFKLKLADGYKSTNDEDTKRDLIIKELMKLKDNRIVCANCSRSKECGYINKAINRYPYLFFTNFLLIGAMACVATYWTIRATFLTGHNVEVLSPLLASVLLISIVAIAFLCLFMLLYGIGKSPQSIVKKIRWLIIIGGIIILFSLVGLFFIFGISITSIP